MLFSYTHYKYQNIPESIWEKWGACSKEWEQIPFQSSDWCRSIGDSSNNNYMLLMIIVANEQEVGFLPYRREKIQSGGILPLNYCSPWADWLPSWLIVVPGEKQGFYDRLIAGVYQQLPRWDKLKTGLISSDMSIDRRHNGLFQSKNIPYSTESVEMAKIDGFASFDDFLNHQSKKWRAQYRRTVRAQFERGNAKVEHLTEFDDENLELLKERIMAIYRKSWKANDNSPLYNLTHEKPYKEFSNLFDSYAKGKGLHIMFITIDDDDAAFYLGVHSNGIYCSLQTAYKEKYKKLSIGYLAQMEDFRYTIEQKFKTNNLLANQEYKTHLTNNVETYTQFICFNNTFFGKLAYYLGKLKLHTSLRRLSKRT
ncbi:MAG: GNAT family N-acetyltransferase [Pseudomonadales bacterium]